MTVSDFQVLIKSCSIESRNDPSPKSEVVHETKFSLKISHSTHACLAQLDQHQTSNPVMVSVLSSNPTGGNFIFFLRHLDANFVQKWQKCQICVIYENLEWSKCFFTRVDCITAKIARGEDFTSVTRWTVYRRLDLTQLEVRLDWTLENSENSQNFANFSDFSFYMG